MKLQDIQSKDILPDFASDLDWVQNAFDIVLKQTNNRAKSIDAPLTMESIEALTDEELQLIYEQFGIASYYPDLSRETRNRMLYEMCRMYRYLGTPTAIETLCKYIFDTTQIDVRVTDNLAFNEAGELVDESLLNTFDIEVDPFYETLPADGAKRIRDNVLNFSRNSQALRGIYYSLPDNWLELPVAAANPADHVGVVICIENNELCTEL